MLGKKNYCEGDRSSSYSAHKSIITTPQEVDTAEIYHELVGLQWFPSMADICVYGANVQRQASLDTCYHRHVDLYRTMFAFHLFEVMIDKMYRL